MEMWNKRLNRENLTEFYNETIEMVYPSVYSICKETTRTEQAIVKSYVDVFQQRQNISGEEVMYVFGDILLKNANDIVEKYELPEGLTFGERNLDEYTRNSMLEKIGSKIDSKGFKVAEFISSDAKKIHLNRDISFPAEPADAGHLFLIHSILSRKKEEIRVREVQKLSSL